MPDQIYINDILIGPKYITEFPKISESLSFDSALNISDSCEMGLCDSLGRFNPAVAGSLFKDQSIGSEMRVYNTDLGRDTFKGKITNITVQGAETELEITSDISAAAESTCTYSNNNILPAEAIYEILTKPKIETDTSTIILPCPKKKLSGLISTDYIVRQTFEDAIRYQESNRANIEIAIEDSESDNNTSNVGDVISKLLKAGHCSIYSYGNLVYLHQWKAETKSGIPITTNDINANSIKWCFAQDEAFKVKNQYRIAYRNGDSILWATGKNTSLIDKYGLGRFCIPDESVQSSDSEDYNILHKYYAGAKWCGELALSRFSSPVKQLSFSAPIELEDIRVGTIITLQDAPYAGWNCIIIGSEKSASDNNIDFTTIVTGISA